MYVCSISRNRLNGSDKLMGLYTYDQNRGEVFYFQTTEANLPSKAQIGDEVAVSFDGWRTSQGAYVFGIHFRPGEVLYDLDIVGSGDIRHQAKDIESSCIEVKVKKTTIPALGEELNERLKA